MSSTLTSPASGGDRLKRNELGRRPRAARSALALVAAATLVLGAVGSASGSPERATIKVTDKAIVLPSGGLHAGINSLHVVGSGHAPFHLIFFALKPGVSFERFDAVANSQTGDPEQVSSIEGGNGSASPGTAVDVYLVLPAGQYAIVNLVHGNPAAEFHTTIAKSPTHEAAPHSLGAVDARKGVDRYRLPAGFGRPGVYKFRNLDKDTHEATLVRLAPGKSVQDLITWAKTRMGPPPAQPFGGFGAVRGHGHGWFVLPSLPPGKYALACFVPDSMGVPHVASGMAVGFSR